MNDNAIFDTGCIGAATLGEKNATHIKRVRQIGIYCSVKLKILVFLYSCFDIDMDEQTSKTIPRTKHTHPQMVSN